MLLEIGMMLLVGAPGGGRTWIDSTAADPFSKSEEAADRSLDAAVPAWAKPMTLEDAEWRGASFRSAEVTADDALPRGIAPLDPLLEGAEPKQNPPSRDLSIDFGVHGQWSMPYGHAYGRGVEYRGVTYITRTVDWGDIYEPGWGFDVKGDIFFGGKDPGLNAGLGILLSMDVYGRGRVSDVFSGDFATSNLTMNCLLVGATLTGGNEPGFYGKGFLGVGPVHYSTVTATVSGVGVTQFEATFTRSTWTIAGDIRGDLGYRIGHLGIVLGVGVRIQAPPNEGTDFHVNSGVFYTFDVNFGLELGF
jgi:hypothetical protein